MKLLEAFHMKKKIFLMRPLLALAILFVLFGCGTGKDLKRIEGNPEILYKEGLARFNKRDYSEALKKFEELKSSFPDHPPYTVWAELKVGDCHFLKEEYPEAIAAYEEFKKIHPSHEEIPYVQFQIGMSYFNQMLSRDRDQTFTNRALSSFEYLIASFPPSLFTEKAKEKVAVCKERLADHEFYIGNFYYSRGRFEAAARRFEGLLEKFPKVPEEDRTLYLLGKSYLELGLWERAEVVFVKIVTEYPKSPHFKEARAILDKGPTYEEVSLRKAKGSTKKDEGDAIDPNKIAWIKFEEEGKQPVPLEAEKKVDLRKEDRRSTSMVVTGEPVEATPPKDEPKEQVSPPAIEPIQENRVEANPPSVETNKSQPMLPVEPMKEDRVQPPPPPLSADAASEVEVIPDEEKRAAAFPATPAPSKEKETVEQKALLETNKAKLADPVDKSQLVDATSDKNAMKKASPEKNEAKLADSVDRSQPIDITSDKVETHWKENLVIFKGNVIARQKDIVIYADSVEVLTHPDGKGVERVIAGGNVKIQQGLRVAHCQKAILYNPDQKLVLTGDPKVSEGDNMVLGDEIIFDIDKNRVEVKGGPSGRGKAKVQPGEIEKLK
jgi:outer membrane protein assembly factor BamD